MRYLILSFFLFFSIHTLIGQDFSNKGKEFWIPYSYHVGMTPGGSGNGPVVMTLYITTDITTNYTVEIFGGTILKTKTITAGQVDTVNVPNTYFIDNEGLFRNKAVRVTALNPIVVYSYITQNAVSAATVCLPSNVLGKEYYSTNFTQVSNAANSNSYFTIIAIEDNTSIEIIPAANTKNGWIAGRSYTIILNKGEIYQVLGAHNNQVNAGLYYGEDLTGSKIRSISTQTSSCKRIAVFSGAGKIRIGANCGNNITSDNLFQQLYPLSTWGKTFLTVPSYSRPNNFYRIIKSSPTASVYVNNQLVPSTSFVNNLYYEFSGNAPNKIESNEPISVAQYFTTQGCSGNSSPFDPDMIILNPVEQTISNVTLVSSNLVALTGRQHHIHVIIPNKGNGIPSFRLDGNIVSPNLWVQHPENPNFSYLYLNNVAQGYHTLSSDSGFNALAYGYAGAESYGYSAGSNVRDLSQFVSIKNEYAKVDFPATCKLTPFNFSVTVPYKTLKLDWDFGGSFPKETNSAPVPDDVIKKKNSNEDSLYVYKLNKIYAYPNTGSFPVDITLINQNSTDGCTGEQVINYQVQVYERPKAGFEVVTNNCQGTDIQLKDTSNGFGRTFQKYNWDIGDGKSYDTKLLAIKTDTSGSYKVVYNAITDIGCITDTITQIIKIDSVPTAKFSIASLTCINKEVTFNDQSSPRGNAVLTNWYWNFNDGTKIDTLSSNASVKRSYTALQTYSPSLVVQTANGCKSSISSITFYNNPNPKADFNVGGICLPDGNGKFTNKSSIADASEGQFKYRWIFGDPNASPGNPDTVFNVKDPIHRYQTTGPFTVKLNVESNKGCIDSITQQLTDIFPQPKANFSVTPEVCLRENTGFKDLSDPKVGTMTGWTWKFNNGIQSTDKEPILLFASAGTYTATFFGTTSNGCNSDTIAKTFVVHPLPTAAFKIVDPACETEQIKFIQEAIANVGTVTRWNWKLGNDASTQDFTDLNALVSSSFTSWGDQSIKLMVENSKGCKSDTAIQTIRIHPKPKVGFTIPEVCLSDASASFTSTSTLADNSSMSYVWNFGDPNATPTNPNIGTGITTNHKYSAARNYVVGLQVTSLAGCVSVFSETFTVNGATPKAGFNVINPSSLCSNIPVGIENTSEVDFGNVSRLEIYWDYVNKPNEFIRDEDPTPNKIYNYLYTAFRDQPAKTITIRVRAYSGGTCVDDELKTITLNGSPVVDFRPVPGICLEAGPRQITEATFTDVVGIAAGKEFYSGTGVASSGIYTASSAGAGTYTITYRFTSSNTCFAETTSNITVWPRPTADFVYSSLNCAKNPITFTSKSVANAGTLVKWNWNYNDGSLIESVSADIPVSHIFSTHATYNVSLDVVTNNGCTSEAKIIPVKVHPLPVVDFDLPKVCLPLGKALFQNKTTIPDGSGNLLTYLWDFGDPADKNPSVSKDGMHNYLSLGSYVVKLIATSNNSCKDSLTKLLTDVFPQPKAGFNSADSTCIGSAIKFTDTSNGIVRPLEKWFWDFGNGSTNNTKDPSYTYPNPGTYSVKLSVVTNEGCLSDTALKSIMIHPYPVVSAGQDMFVLDDGQKQMKATATGQSLRFNWSPAIYLSSTDSLNPFVIRPQEDVVYTLRVTGRGDCMSQDDVLVVSLKLPSPPNTFTPNGDGINDVWEIRYLDQYPGAIVEIYSTQGQLLYRSVEYAKPWDGTYKGNPLPSGTYYYVIDPKSGRKKVAGYVTIFK